MIRELWGGERGNKTEDGVKAEGLMVGKYLVMNGGVPMLYARGGRLQEAGRSSCMVAVCGRPSLWSEGLVVCRGPRHNALEQ